MVHIDGNWAYVDVKKTDCVKIGQRMDVVRDAKQIRHPITQKTIYLPADSIATLEIREIGHEVSKAYTIEQDKKSWRQSNLSL